MATMGFIQSQSIDTTEKQSSIIVPQTFTHSIAFGQTGSGKTSSFIYPNLLQRLKSGHGILVYDYKGKEHLSVKYLAHMAGRLDDIVEIGKPWGESINLIEKMDEDELDKFFDNILKHGEDSKYWQNSAKSLGQTLLAVLKGIAAFSKSLQAIDGVERSEIETSSLEGFRYPTTRTLHSLVKICKTFEVLKVFISDLHALIEEAESMIKTAAKYALAENSLDEELRAKLTDAIAKKEALKIIIETNKNSLDSFGGDSNENLTQNIMGSLLSPLLSLSQNESFNNDEFDITKELNAGKIIIINGESLSNTVMESLNNTILYELSKRTKSLNINPVSIFIDEVQRVVSKNTDLPIDVFREAKVDLFLATQNSALLKEKLKEEKFDALMGNLTQKFYFKSSYDEGLETKLILRELETFSYICSDDDFMNEYKAKPLFLDRDKLILVEFKYQKSQYVLENFLYKYRNAKLILDYDARLYKDNNVIAIDIVSKKEYVLDSLTKENIEYLQDELDGLLESINTYNSQVQRYEDFVA